MNESVHASPEQLVPERFVDQPTRDIAISTATIVRNLQIQIDQLSKEIRDNHNSAEKHFTDYDKIINRGWGIWWIVATMGAGTGAVVTAMLEWFFKRQFS